MSEFLQNDNNVRYDWAIQLMIKKNRPTESGIRWLKKLNVSPNMPTMGAMVSRVNVIAHRSKSR